MQSLISKQDNLEFNAGSQGGALGWESHAQIWMKWQVIERQHSKHVGVFISDIWEVHGAMSYSSQALRL